ncbi:uncharacterized protein LOC113775903 isoform X2 [Coffea eugenioides]|uniref:uncharacterized protein LOC113772169 isoform X2 n=1 Tax=Coffea eugenioides TaxID=49369 RepID=UPI000F615C6A|nr:uncharacterized protein LOC113772169 isoform X2 [Coffea eugenioides]XP_027176755.1 uncharacterized protein LOC113775903 isoform X2 [Coffea eugenioides]
MEGREEKWIGGKFCGSISSFCHHLQSSCDALIQSADRRPIPLDSASTTFMEFLNRRISSTSTDLNLLESMSCDTVSFEELLGHCTQVYNHNQIHLLALQQHPVFSTSAIQIPSSAATDEDQDEEEKDSDDDDLSLSPPTSSSSTTTLPFRSKFQDDPLLDDTLSLKNLGLSDVCLATIASDQGEMRDGLTSSRDSKPRIVASRDDYEGLPKHIKSLASWEDLIVAVEKMNSSLAKRSMKVDTIQQDEISLLGLGHKAKAYLLLLIKMNCMVVETIDGVITYRVL